MKKSTIAIGAAAGAAAVIGGVFLAKVAPARIHELKLRANQERTYRAAQFEIWMNVFRECFCGEPQPVTGPAAIERDIEELRRMKEEAVRRIEARQRTVADDLR